MLDRATVLPLRDGVVTLHVRFPAHWNVVTLATTPFMPNSALRMCAYAPSAGDTRSAGFADLKQPPSDRANAPQSRCAVQAPVPPDGHTGWTFVHEFPLQTHADEPDLQSARWHAAHAGRVLQAHAELWQRDRVLHAWPEQRLQLEDARCDASIGAVFAAAVLLRETHGTQTDVDPLCVLHAALAWEAGGAVTRLLFQAPSSCFAACWHAAGAATLRHLRVAALPTAAGARLVWPQPWQAGAVLREALRPKRDAPATAHSCAPD